MSAGGAQRLRRWRSWYSRSTPLSAADELDSTAQASTSHTPQPIVPVMQPNVSKRMNHDAIVDDYSFYLLMPEPHGWLCLHQRIAAGKYGVVHRARCVSPPIQASNSCNDFAVKTVLDRSSYKYELHAYRRMANPTVSRSKDDSGILMQPDDQIDIKQADYPPLIASLVNSGACRMADGTMKIERLLEEEESRVTVYALVFEYVPGGTLDAFSYKRIHRSMYISEAIFYTAELAETLLWLHERGIIHHDLKANNVLIRANGHIALADFGLAHTSDDLSTRTSGSVLCTSRHMPPEVTLFEPHERDVWHAVDWYSLGALLHRQLSKGEYPPDATREAMELTDPLSLNLRLLPKPCHDLVAQLLHPNPNLRLGGQMTAGGYVVLLHPGLLLALFEQRPLQGVPARTLIPTITRPSIAYTAASLPEVLQRSLKEGVNSPLPSTDSFLMGNENSVPDWVSQFRLAIRNCRLEPPFLPRIR